jgi:hypothetical protein
MKEFLRGAVPLQSCITPLKSRYMRVDECGLARYGCAISPDTLRFLTGLVAVAEGEVVRGRRP